jgi:putative endonuclease
LTPPLIPAKAGIQAGNLSTAGSPLAQDLGEGDAFAPEMKHAGRVMSFYVYILANRRNGTLYIGMTDDLARRVWQHRTGALPGFTSRYGLKILVWYELHDTRESAFLRERQLKKWNRAWKLRLIEHMNPLWRDLFEQLNQ